MKTKLTQFLMVLASVFAVQFHASAEPFRYQNTDVILGFRQTGATFDLELNLGSVTAFQQALPGAVITFPKVTGARLSGLYGAKLEGIKFSVSATQRPVEQPTIVGVPDNTVWATRSRADVNTQSTPWTRFSTSVLGNTSSKIMTIGNLATNYSSQDLGGVITADNQVDLVVVATGSPKSYNTVMGSGNYGGVFQGNAEKETPLNFANGATAMRSDFYEIRPGSGASTYLGYFELTPAGNLSFTKAGGAATPTITIANRSMPEGNAGNTALEFTVMLSASAATAVDVTYSTANGTAIAGTDYVATSGTLQIAAGQTTGIISVPVIGNTTYQADRTFTLQAALGASTANPTGTILDDDLPAITISSSTRVNNDSTVQVNSSTGLKYTLYHTNMAGITAPLSQWTKEAAVNGTGNPLSLTHTTTEADHVYVISVSR